MKYKCTLKINDKELKASGDTMAEVFEKFEQPDVIKTTGLLTVEYGKKRTERALNVPKLKALFGKSVAKEVLFKNIELFLK